MPDRPMHADALAAPVRHEQRVGVAYALAAYVAWGLVPIFFKAVVHVPLFEVLAHRVVWSVTFLAIWLRIRGRRGAVLRTFRDRRTLLTLAGTTVLIAANWTTFVWAMANGQVLQTSLGYFINPLIYVVLGYLFLGERLRPAQKLAVALAAAGVVYLTVSVGTLPWVALLLGVSFGFYGLLRKTVRADALVGLAVETTLLAPFGIAYLGYLLVRGEAVFLALSWQTDALLVFSGIVTAGPLLWFANAARRLRLVTIGLLQYLAPTMHLFLALFLYHEPFSRAHFVAFGCIWTALAIYSADTLRAQRDAAA